MASTSVTLGPHWDEFIALMLKEGRYGSTSELIRASLRLMEEQEGQRARLRGLGLFGRGRVGGRRFGGDRGAIASGT